MDFNFIELPNQTIYVNKWNIINIGIAMPMNGFDVIIRDKNGNIDWMIDTWYLRKESGEYHCGIGSKTKREVIKK